MLRLRTVKKSTEKLKPQNEKIVLEKLSLWKWDGKKHELKNHTESASSTLPSPLLSESLKYGNEVEGYGVEETKVSLGLNPLCSNVLQLLPQPIESKTSETQLTLSFLSGTRKNPESKSLYVSVTKFP